jgi:RNA polymerase sigma-70 factor, ECF subfamily
VHEPTTDALVARAVAGDRAAFELLTRRFWPRIFALALQISGNRNDAEDIAQETFLRVHRSLARFEARSSFQTWLYRIALNRAFTELRSARGRRPTPAVDDDRVLAALAVDAPDPSAATELAESYALLVSALDRLSPPLKSAVVLVELQQLSHAEAAAIAGVTRGTIAWRIHEARRQLQQTLQPISEVRRRAGPERRKRRPYLSLKG